MTSSLRRPHDKVRMIKLWGAWALIGYPVTVE